MNNEREDSLKLKLDLLMTCQDDNEDIKRRQDMTS
jgi:hypothetical protein